MIHIAVLTSDGQLKKDVPLHSLSDADVKWYWVDFDSPTEEEATLFKTHFGFHHLAIEDCFHIMQRPKLDYYEGYYFFVLQSINPDTMESEELDVFLGHNYVISFHLLPSREIEDIRQRKLTGESALIKGAIYIFYLIMDKIVDEYFPVVYQMEDKQDKIELKKADSNFIENLYEVRTQLLTLRCTIVPMQELLYRILNSERLVIPTEDRIYFQDIYDHLMRLTEMIESNREITADIRDNYLSLSTNRMNIIMKTLTIVTSIFIPLTFIVGVYGMNFDYMPELTWHWGYFIVMGIMAVLSVGMVIGFWLKGWFK